MVNLANSRKLRKPLFAKIAKFNEREMSIKDIEYRSLIAHGRKIFFNLLKELIERWLISMPFPNKK